MVENTVTIHLEQSFAFPWKLLSNIFFPRQKSFFFNDFHIIEMHKEAQ